MGESTAREAAEGHNGDSAHDGKVFAAVLHEADVYEAIGGTVRGSGCMSFWL